MTEQINRVATAIEEAPDYEVEFNIDTGLFRLVDWDLEAEHHEFYETFKEATDALFHVARHVKARAAIEAIIQCQPIEVTPLTMHMNRPDNSLDGEDARLKAENKRLWEAFKNMPTVELEFNSHKDMRLWDSWKAKYRDILDVALEVSNDS